MSTIRDQVLQDFQDFAKDSFPIEIFPVKIQTIIKGLKEDLGFSEDFTSASMLFACSVAIGNSYTVSNGLFEKKANLYLAIVARAGINKSHVLDWALKPLEERDKNSFKDYRESLKTYEHISSLTKKELKEMNLSSEDIHEPTLEQLLLSDYTPEGLAEVHRDNERGIGIHKDEFRGWFENFNKYNSGSEESFWLSVWSGSPIKINRKLSKPLMIPNPFISVAGTIQPEPLKKITTDDRRNSGFLDRILFVYPECIQKSEWKQTDRSFSKEWSLIVNSLLEKPYNPESNNILFFSNEAKDELFNWQKANTAIINKSESNIVRGIRSKLEDYILRFCLIIELIECASKGIKPQNISVKTFKRAVSLVEYFFSNAMRVHENTLSNPLSKFTENVQKWFNELPQSFTKNEAVSIAENHSISKRSVHDYLREKNLFIHVKHGNYKKAFN